MSVQSFEVLRQTVADLPRFHGITPLDAANLPEPLNDLMRKLIRQGSMTVEQLAAELGVNNGDGQLLADEMVAAGLLKIEESNLASGSVYRVYYARTRSRSLPLEL
jgi:predicted transcriptional regulator